MLLTKEELLISVFALQTTEQMNHLGQYEQRQFPLADQKTAVDLFDIFMNVATGETEQQKDFPETAEVSLSTSMKTLLLSLLNRKLTTQDSKVALKLREKLEGSEIPKKK